jgi:glycosyltransferase involved in cell wall biosynthesis
MYSKKSITISGTDYDGVTEGGFFDFNSTNIYKADQTKIISQMFRDGKIKDGDTFFFYDIWHPGVISLRYMIDLNEFKNCKIYGILHAGCYDPTDILGMKGLNDWASGFEAAMIKACDKVFVATEYHANMVKKARRLKVHATGLPFSFEDLDRFKKPIEKKENIMVFPHRLSPDKQPEIFDELKDHFPGWTFIRTGDFMDIGKDGYYELLAKSKIQFSASLHENWGISVFESMYLGCVPILPDRCSYSEMYGDKIELYPSLWTLDKPCWERCKPKLIDFIHEKIANFGWYSSHTESAIAAVIPEYCNWDKIEKEII